MHVTRRSFLQRAATAAIAHASLFHSFGSMNAIAQTANSDNDYKAMICIYLFGGNDANNMLIPLDSTSFSMYTKARGRLALSPDLIRPLGGGKFGIHPSMPNTQSLYNKGSLGFIANMGPLVEPTTKAQYVGSLTTEPDPLFDHPGGATLMQTGLQSATEVNGWGGRIAESLASSYHGVTPMCTSFYGSQPFINGNSISGLIAPTDSGNLFCGSGDVCDPRVHGNDQMLALKDSNPLVAADQKITARMLDLNRKYASISSQAPKLQTSFGDGFQDDIKRIVNMIQMRQAFKSNRQVFFVGMGGFDFHGDQLGSQAALLNQLDAGIGTLASALQEIGVYDKVTITTLSDFGRTLQPNATGGSDHAWGSHNIIMGGAVSGGQIFGSYPMPDPGGPDDAGGNSGIWIPTTSVSELGAVMAAWFGVPSEQIGNIFPCISNFVAPQTISPSGSRSLPLFRRAV